jgi:hypothetical protein
LVVFSCLRILYRDIPLVNHPYVKNINNQVTTIKQYLNLKIINSV